MRVMVQRSLFAGRRIRRSECGRESRPAPFDPITASGMQKPQMTGCSVGGPDEDGGIKPPLQETTRAENWPHCAQVAISASKEV
jgi:hypothetical protein